MSRRDYHRFEPWMGRVTTASCLFAGVALLAAGHLVWGVLWGLAAVASATLARR